MYNWYDVYKYSWFYNKESYTWSCTIDMMYISTPDSISKNQEYLYTSYQLYMIKCRILWYRIRSTYIHHINCTWSSVGFFDVESEYLYTSYQLYMIKCRILCYRIRSTYIHHINCTWSSVGFFVVESGVLIYIISIVHDQV